MLKQCITVYAVKVEYCLIEYEYGFGNIKSYSIKTKRLSEPLTAYLPIQLDDQVNVYFVNSMLHDYLRYMGETNMFEVISCKTVILELELDLLDAIRESQIKLERTIEFFT